MVRMEEVKKIYLERLIMTNFKVLNALILQRALIGARIITLCYMISPYDTGTQVTNPINEIIYHTL